MYLSDVQNTLVGKLVVAGTSSISLRLLKTEMTNPTKSVLYMSLEILLQIFEVFWHLSRFLLPTCSLELAEMIADQHKCINTYIIGIKKKQNKKNNTHTHNNMAINIKNQNIRYIKGKF